MLLPPREELFFPYVYYIKPIGWFHTTDIGQVFIGNVYLKENTIRPLFKDKLPQTPQPIDQQRFKT